MFMSAIIITYYVQQCIYVAKQVISHELDAPNVFPLVYVLLTEFVRVCSLHVFFSLFLGFSILWLPCGGMQYVSKGWIFTHQRPQNLNKHQRQVTCRMRMRRTKQSVWFQERTVILIRNVVT